MHGIELLEKGIHELNLEITETQKKQQKNNKIIKM